MTGMSYKKLTIMMIISFMVMYFVMYLNMDRAIHYHTSITRVYMTVLMVAPMAIMMILLMGKMYPNKPVNAAIIGSAIALFIISLIALRTQTPIGDIDYMKAMIPHHSSAIMTSKHADIKDPEVKKLSEQIIKSQEEEIALMERLLKELK